MENKNIFAQWDNANLEDIQKEIQDAKNNSGGDFKEVPHGVYEVSVEKMELKATKQDKKPMVSIWFNIVGDDCKGQKIFMNQVITQGFQIHIVNELLRSMIQDCPDAPDVEFRSYSQYNNLLMDIHELIADSFEYALDYGQTKKGFDTFSIKEVYALED